MHRTRGLIIFLFLFLPAMQTFKKKKKYVAMTHEHRSTYYLNLSLMNCHVTGFSVSMTTEVNGFFFQGGTTDRKNEASENRLGEFGHAVG